jgi:hypothetical protein
MVSYSTLDELIECSRPIDGGFINAFSNRSSSIIERENSDEVCSASLSAELLSVFCICIIALVCAIFVSVICLSICRCAARSFVT